MTPIPNLSVVLPVYNEVENIPLLHRRLTAVLGESGYSYEIIYIDDGSSDGSVDILRALAEADSRVGLAVFSRNFGHQIALSAGLAQARGDAIILMDSDLQDPPEVIPELVAVWKEGFDVVHAQRKTRPGESIFKRSTAFLFYRFLGMVAEVDIPPDTGDFRLLSRRAADVLRNFSEKRRFWRGLVPWVGFRQGKVFFERPARTSGESKYRLGAMIRLAMTGAFSFSSFPVTLIGVVGVLVCAGSLVAVGAGLPVQSAGLFFLSGVQLIGLWVLGQYVLGVTEEVRNRPLYVVRETINLQPSPANEA